MSMKKTKFVAFDADGWLLSASTLPILKKKVKTAIKYGDTQLGYELIIYKLYGTIKSKCIVGPARKETKNK